MTYEEQKQYIQDIRDQLHNEFSLNIYDKYLKNVGRSYDSLKNELKLYKSHITHELFPYIFCYYAYNIIVISYGSILKDVVKCVDKYPYIIINHENEHYQPIIYKDLSGDDKYVFNKQEIENLLNIKL